MRSILLAIIAISLTGCVQNGTIGNGQLDPGEQEAIEAIVEQVQQIIADKKKQKVDEATTQEPDVPADPVKDATIPDVVVPSSTKENGSYLGRYNGDRPTWYLSKVMSAYPTTLSFTVKGCIADKQITNNGTRWEAGGYIVKQSDVPLRGMAIVAPASCKSKIAWVEY